MSKQTNTAPEPLDCTGRIIAFENGELDREEVIELLTDLRDNGLLFQLQGFYQRVARDLGVI